MSPYLINGSILAERQREQIRNEVRSLRSEGVLPCLAAIRIGEDPAASAYARSQAREASSCQIEYRLVELQPDILVTGALAVIEELNTDPSISGIMLHLPLPAHLDAFLLQQAIAPRKDVEGVGATNLGLLLMGRKALVPCTAAAAMACLKSLANPIEGRQAVVVGRSVIVGKPLALLLLESHATVTICHSRTRNLSELTRRAEILMVAAGRPGLIGAEHVSPGCIVIDVGIHRVESKQSDGKPIMKTVGDVRFDEVAAIASAITPVPGGVGPLTVAMLLENTVRAAKREKQDPRA
jgi:methylenetetrahydrofolate dehydrogenase (NADP+)/methenyltetrahydrofolate cyclohydrolase